MPWLASVSGIFFMRQFFATIPQELQRYFIQGIARAGKKF